MALDMPEKDCGGEIYDAIFMAVRQSLVACNTRDAVDDSIKIGINTILTPTAATMQ